MTLKTAQRSLKELLKPYHVDHNTLMTCLNLLESVDDTARKEQCLTEDICEPVKPGKSKPISQPENTKQ